MGILTKKEIISEIKKGRLGFEPGLDQFQLQPAAVDVRVGENFYIPKIWGMTERGREGLSFDYSNKNKEEILDCVNLKPGQAFELLPGEFILISTFEKIAINCGDLIGILYSRSSTNRRGMGIESGVIDPYYEGFLMIPVLNQTRSQKICIYPGERIAQIVFERTESELSKEDSLMHGVVPPKYHGINGCKLDYKFDANDEVEAIKSGDIIGLKERFEVKI